MIPRRDALTLFHTLAMCMCSLYGSRTISPSPVLYSCRHTNSQAVVTCVETGGLSEESEWTTNSAMVCTGANLRVKWKLSYESR